MVGQGASCPSHLKRFLLTKRFHARAVGHIYVDRRFFIYTSPCARLCGQYFFSMYSLNYSLSFALFTFTVCSVAWLLECEVGGFVRFLNMCLIFSTQPKQQNKSHTFSLPPWNCFGHQCASALPCRRGVARGQQQKQNSIGGPYHPPLWRCHSTETQQACWVVEG